MKRIIFLIAIAGLTTTLFAQKEFLGNWKQVMLRITISAIMNCIS